MFSKEAGLIKLNEGGGFKISQTTTTTTTHIHSHAHKPEPASHQNGRTNQMFLLVWAPYQYDKQH